ncbi:DegT/DnrJ/EryC1/StrS family aminotransferase [Candidatus Woesearchaeota archaeon]|nr:DegT/DnrJ/EryC1/StrS family aminotransferase [Candidatus Woesearchaeota archaeon]
MIPFVDLKANYLSIKEEIDNAIQFVINNSDFIMGESVSLFENNFAKYCGGKHCVAVSNGTSALEIALKAHGISHGDEVICPVNTYIATAEAIINVGAVVKFVDIDEKTYNIDPSKIVISESTKAIIPVHLYGQTVDMDPIIKIAQENDLIIIEDCAQAHGVMYKGKKVPIYGTGCFSFYPSKNLGAFGDAGAIVTDNEDVAREAKLIRNHGFSKNKHRHEIIGTNNRMDSIQAAVLSVKLKHLDKWNDMRIRNAKLYLKLLNMRNSISKHVYHLFVIRSKNRDKLVDYLTQKGVQTGIHYPFPLHKQEALARHTIEIYPVAEMLSKEILSLPMYPELSKEDIKYVCDLIKEFNNSQI